MFNNLQYQPASATKEFGKEQRLKKTQNETDIDDQNKKLDEIEEKYDIWEDNLNKAELALFQYQDKIESLTNDDIRIDQLIESLKANYQKLEDEVNALQNKYPKREEKTSIVDACDVLNLYRKLSMEIDSIIDTPFMKSINLNTDQSLINEVLTEKNV